MYLRAGTGQSKCHVYEGYICGDMSTHGFVQMTFFVRSKFQNFSLLQIFSMKAAQDMRPLVYLQVVTSKSVLEIFAARCDIHFSVLQVMHCSLKSRPRIIYCTISLLHIIYPFIMFQYFRLKYSSAFLRPYCELN
ncbi:hypothetical protein XENOCAPTIV_027092 [Xenoophorus captivus]|uniref:Uncharacterized protein n=1 Tax=Xenoophorus captivus TaxID=1517983 RepID=A0ABV0RKP7_9TELE